MEHQSESLFADPRLWVAIAFTIFFVIFGRKFWTLVTAMLDKRGLAIQSELDEASRLRQEAEALLEGAKTSREAALREAELMLENARQEAIRLGEAMRFEAATAAARRERMAMDRISAAENAAISDVRLAAADIAAHASAEVISLGFDSAADRQLIDQAITNLPAALSGRRAA